MRWGRVLVIVALVATSFVGTRWLADAASPAVCQDGDRPETGIQGDVPVADQLSGRSKQGYSCNIRAVGTNDLGGLGGDIQLTWSGTCAYQGAPKGDAASDGVAVLDVHDPANPVLQPTILREPEWAGQGGTLLGIHEGIHANDAAHILVVPIGYSITVYDITNCLTPRRLSYFAFDPPDDPFHDPSAPNSASGIHSGQLSPDGTLYFATDIGNGGPQGAPNGPCLTIIDLKNPAAPSLYTRWGTDFPCHDLTFNPEGTRAYAGYYEPNTGYAAAVVSAFTPVYAPSNALSGVKVVDTSELLNGARPANPVLPVLGQVTGGRQHTEVFARIGADHHPYLLSAEEGYCPGGNGRIIDLIDEHHPVELAEIPLEVNTAPNCAQAAYNQNVDILHYMSHYLSVDDPSNAHLAFYTWYGSGLRVFDISDPRNPHEVAYYNPPVGDGSSRTQDWSTTYPRYVAKSGQIWFGSRVNGLNVVELAPGLRPGPGRRAWSRGAHPLSGTVVAGLASRSIPAAEPNFGFCTLR